ncbi:MAG: hypothetical protein ABDH29_03135 [Aquificaceae bacterium]
MGKLLLSLFFVSLSAFSQEGSKDCQSNPLKDKEYCRYIWGVCKGLGIRRLEGIKSCLEKSPSYEEGVRCFERSWIEDLFKR